MLFTRDIHNTLTLTFAAALVATQKDLTRPSCKLNFEILTIFYFLQLVIIILRTSFSVFKTKLKNYLISCKEGLVNNVDSINI